MPDRLSGRVGLTALMIALLTAIPAQAAPPRQEETPSPSPEPTRTPTPTPSPTPTGSGRVPVPTEFSTPGTNSPGGATPTLLPAPEGGGRVSADALYVRDDPSFEGKIIGVIPYNQSVYPIGRNANTTWIAINWSDRTGWVFAGLVVWDAKLNFEALPVMAPANLTPFPSDTAAAITLTVPVTQEITQPASPTSTTAPTRLPTTSNTPAPSPSVTHAAPLATATTGAVGGSTPDAPAASLLDALPPGAKIGGLIAVGVLIVAGGAYVFRRRAAGREAARYDKGFALSICPVCIDGHVHMEEMVKSTLGVRRVSRTARCDNCHSVLREVRPGLWRYTVDSYVNAEMAERYNNRHLKDDDLQKLAEAVTEDRFRQDIEREQAEPQLDLSWLDVSYEDQSAAEDGDRQADQAENSDSEGDP